MQRQKASASIVEFWRHFKPTSPPHVHPQDASHIRDRFKYVEFTTVEPFTDSSYFGNHDTILQLGLLPVPYIGDLAKAKIFVLLLNRGFEAGDLWGEHQAHELGEALRKTLNQELVDEKFPFIFLNPQFCWTGGYRWWEAKLRDIAAAYSREKAVRYQDALAALSRALACLELIPYHSASRPGGLERLPSAKAAISYVHEELVERARRGEITLIITRQVASWGVTDVKPEHDIILYDRGAARGASLSMNSRGGQAILRRLLRA